MGIRIFWIALHMIAATLPLMTFNAGASAVKTEFLGWPKTFDGRELQRLELSKDEKGFARGFPGHIARFTNGTDEIIIRRLVTKSRKLHPAADCLKGAGYKIKPVPIRRDSEGRLWGCVIAKRGEKRLRVCEIVFDENGSSWSDVSSWYWAAVLNRTKGPWWAMTVASVEQAGG